MLFFDAGYQDITDTCIDNIAVIAEAYQDKDNPNIPLAHMLLTSLMLLCRFGMFAF